MKLQEFAPDPAAVADLIERPAAPPVPEAIAAPGATAPGVAAGATAQPEVLPDTLPGLLALRDIVFVEAAYRRVLGREADPSGVEHYLGRLRAGDISKTEILGALRYSPEGQQRGVVLPGLAPRYALRKFARLPVVGWIYQWIVTFLRLPALLRTLHRLQAETEQAEATAAPVIRRVDTFERRLQAFDRRVEAAEERVDAADGWLRELREQARRMLVIEKTVAERQERLADANGRLLQQLRELSAEVAAGGRAAAPAPAGAGAAASPALDALYLEFEDRFRGSREETKRQQETYLDVVKKAGAGTAAAPVLDLGCGRGEWLELLREHGCVARGVDANRVMVAESRSRGLEVADQDVLSYLAAQPDGSAGMITGFHLIEHLPFDVLVQLFDECRRVLRPGGCIVFETPNPENLVVAAYTFYFDPTHRHPLPPQLTEFLAEQRGFSRVELLRLHPRAEAGADEVLLDAWFRGPADYAVVGWK